jgi:predicted dehydrogenase
MNKVRLGLIGMGMIGKLHAETMSKMQDIEFVAASDADAKHQKTADELGTKFYQSYEEMIGKEKMDGVVIAVPNELHLPVGAACAKKGLHLLMEKPIAADLESADRLIRAAEESKVHLMVGHHRRHNPLIEELRNIVRGGQIGKLVGVTALWSLYKPKDYFKGAFAWRAQPGGGPIRINLIHEIDNIRYICGDITHGQHQPSDRGRRRGQYFSHRYGPRKYRVRGQHRGEPVLLPQPGELLSLLRHGRGGYLPGDEKILLSGSSESGMAVPPLRRGSQD